MDAANYDICESDFLLAQALFEATLHDTASVFVRSDLVTVVHASIVNELSVSSEFFRSWAVSLIGRVRSLEGQKEGLDDVISIWVCGKIENILRHLGTDHQDLVMHSCKVFT